jgi:hypothetical protein
MSTRLWMAVMSRESEMLIRQCLGLPFDSLIDACTHEANRP